MRRAGLALVPLALCGAAPETPIAPCSTVPPYQNRVEVGHARGRNQAEAIAAAQAAGRAVLLEKACAGAGELRCARIGRGIAPWAFSYDPRAKSACAVMAVAADVLDSHDRELQLLRSELGALAGTVAKRVDTLPLALQPPTWASGCVAGDLGAALVAEIRNGLARHPTARLVEENADGAAQVAITLVPGREVVTVAGGLQLPGEETWAPLPGFSFALDLFDVESTEVGTCLANAALGLVNGARTGTGGLTAEVEVATSDGQLCEGASFETRIVVDRPSRVQVYSIAQDGTAFLIFPNVPANGDGRVVSEFRIPAQAVTLPEFPGDESIVAIAIPEGASFGGADRWRTFCRVPGKFGAGLYPTGAAVARATYQVTPPATPGCAPFPAEQRDPVVAQLKSAPLCE